MSKTIKASSGGIKPLVLLTILLIVLLFIPGSVVQYAAAFYFILVSISLLYSRILRSSIVVTHIMDELRSPRFEFLDIKLRVENRSFLPVFCLFIDDKPGVLSISADTGRALFHLRARESVLFTYTVNSNTRGEYFAGPAEIRGSDPLGLFPFILASTSKCRILIYPAKTDEQFSFTKGVPQGKIAVKNPLYEDTSMYRSVRDYESGDEIKRINWKASARFAKLFTNEYVTTLSSQCFAFLDLEIEKYPDHLRYEHAEHAVETCAQILKFACSKYQNCGFASTGILPSQENANPFIRANSSQLGILLDTLALIQIHKKAQDITAFLEKCIISCPSGGTFFYFGPAGKKEEISVKAKMLRPSLNFIPFFFGEDYE